MTTMSHDASSNNTVSALSVADLMTTISHDSISSSTCTVSVLFVADDYEIANF